MSGITYDTVRPEGQAVKVDPWPSEQPLCALLVLAALALWIVILVSIVGAIYAMLFGAFFFVSHIAFIAYLRGSAVRVGPDQFPELYNRVVELSARIGLSYVPEIYLMQAGGSLNALATKLFRSNFIVLYSDLLDACDDNKAARDMIIGHELGHLRAHHLSLIWILMPALFIPFLGSAYSRAREYTCDRYGHALSPDSEGALRGLAILAAGAKHGPKVNLQAFVKQRASLNTGLMTLGAWLSTHPPLCDRVAALNPQLGGQSERRLRGPLTALMIIFLVVALPVALASWGIGASKEFRDGFMPGFSNRPYEQPVQVDHTQSIEKVKADLKSLAEVVEEARAKTGHLPPDSVGLSSVWAQFRPDKHEPYDPFDGIPYGYYITDEGKGYIIWSCGPDCVNYTDDDILHRSTDTTNAP